MKFIITLFFTLQIGNFCIAQTYKLKGNVTDLTADSVLLVKHIGKNIEQKMLKVNDGKFFYEDKLKEPFFIQIIKIKNGTNDKPDGKLTEFMVESSTIKITGKSAKFEDVTVEGSKADKLLKSYLKEDTQLSEKWNVLKESFDNYVKQKDSVNRRKVGIQLNHITFQERVPLLKKYVARYGTSIVGALLPAFCQFDQILKKEDYLEMYNSLSTKIKQSDYAKSILNRSK